MRIHGSSIGLAVWLCSLFLVAPGFAPAQPKPAAKSITVYKTPT